MQPFIKRKRFRKSTPKDGTTPVTSNQAQLALARKVQKLQKAVRGIQPEVKYFESSGVFANVVDTTGGINGILTVAAGTDISDRISDKIRIKALRVQVRVSTGVGSIGATPTSEEFTRFILVQDTQQVADSVPAANLVVSNTALPQFPTPSLNSNGRFKWLWVSPLFVHSRIAQSSVAAALTVPTAPTQSPVAWYTNTKMDLPVTYNGTAGTDIQKNGLYLVCLTNLAADTLDCDANIRIDYIDD